MTDRIIIAFLTMLTMSCSVKHYVKRQQRQSRKTVAYNDRQLITVRQNIASVSDTILEVNSDNYYWLYKTQNNSMITFTKRKNFGKIKIESVKLRTNFDTLTKFINHYRVDTVKTIPKTNNCDDCSGFGLTLVIHKDTIVKYYFDGATIDTTHVKARLSNLTTDFIKKNYR